MGRLITFTIYKRDLKRNKTPTQLVDLVLVVYVGIVYRKKPHEKITIKRTIFQVKNYH
jgi:hypothetical protein